MNNPMPPMNLHDPDNRLRFKYNCLADHANRPWVWRNIERAKVMLNAFMDDHGLTKECVSFTYTSGKHPGAVAVVSGSQWIYGYEIGIEGGTDEERKDACFEALCTTHPPESIDMDSTTVTGRIEFELPGVVAKLNTYISLTDSDKLLMYDLGKFKTEVNSYTGGVCEV